MLKLYENIKALRLEKHMTQDDLARRAGYTDRSSIAKIERGVVDLPQSKIKQFADIFGVTPATLMGWVDPATGEKNNHLANLVVKMRREPDFFDAVAELAELTPEQFEFVRGVIKSLPR